MEKAWRAKRQARARERERDAGNYSLANPFQQIAVIATAAIACPSQSLSSNKKSGGETQASSSHWAVSPGGQILAQANGNWQNLERQIPPKPTHPASPLPLEMLSETQLILDGDDFASFPPPTPAGFLPPASFHATKVSRRGETGWELKSSAISRFGGSLER